MISLQWKHEIGRRKGTSERSMAIPTDREAGGAEGAGGAGGGRRL